jgi:hypothetical protein
MFGNGTGLMSRASDWIAGYGWCYAVSLTIRYGVYAGVAVVLALVIWRKQ